MSTICLGVGVGLIVAQGIPRLAIANWRLDETSDTVAADQINSPDQDGTYVSATVGAVDGIYGDNKAPDFDKVNDYIELDNASGVLDALFDRRQHTVMIWAKVNDWTDGTQEFFILLDGEAVEFRINSSGQIEVLQPGTDPKYTPGNLLGWVHVAYTRDEAENESKLYFNGVLKNTKTATSWSLGSGAARFHWGTNTETISLFGGSLAHGRLYNQVLTATQIAEIADRTNNGSGKYTQTFFTMGAQQPAAPLTVPHLTNMGATRTTSPFASGGAYLDQLLHTEDLHLFLDSNANLHPVAGKTLYFGAWIQIDSDGAEQAIVSSGIESTSGSDHNFTLWIDTVDRLALKFHNGALNSTPTPIAGVTKDVKHFVGMYINFDTKTAAITLDGSAYNTVVGTSDPNQNLGLFVLGVWLLTGLTWGFDGTYGPCVLINQPKAHTDPLIEIYNSGTPLTTLSAIEAAIDDPTNLKLCNLWPVTTTT